MRSDPSVLARAAEDALRRFGEVIACLQYGEGWACAQPARPHCPAMLLGHDDRDDEVWMRRSPCVALSAL
jgi:hypothetical protein